MSLKFTVVAMVTKTPDQL